MRREFFVSLKVNDFSLHFLSIHPRSLKVSSLIMSATPSPSASTSSISDQTSATSADLPPSPTQQQLELPDEVKQEKAIAFKDEGNKLFLAGEFDKAKLKYGEGIALDPRIVTLWSNRAACELKLEQHGLAIEDASK